ncbi:T9SS type A sorting domain-containing protein [bacterium]|nr:T9SS type A sorting domain-containing protein [bacterium]
MTRYNLLLTALMCISFTVSGISGVSLLCDNSSETRFSVDFEQPQIRDFGGGYSYISLADFGPRGEEYGPQLAGLAYSLAIPRGSSVSVEIESVEWSEWIEVLPVPRCEEVFSKSKIVPGNSRLYSIPSGGTIDYIGKKTIRGVEIADIDVQPLEYHPTYGVRFMRNAIISVKYAGGGSTAPDPAYYHYAFEELFRATLINPSKTIPRMRPQESTEWDPDDGAELLVIAYPYFVDEFEPWLDWKLHMGMPTKVVSTTETGTDTASIKAYIQNAYDTWVIKPAYVLFVGDAENVTTYMSLSTGSCIGDNEYGCVDGSDYFPDVFLGRMSCDASSQVDLLVQKQLNYECHPDTTDDWYARAIGIVSEDDPTWDPLGPQDSSYLAAVTYGMGQCTAAGFTDVQLLRRHDGDDFYTAKPYFEAGCGLIQFRGQAWPDYYYFGNYESAYGGLDTLDNDGKCPVNISISCGTGGFMSGDTRMCERSTRAGTISNPKGCVAFMGQTAVSSNSEERSSLSKHIYEGLFEEDLNQLGAAHTYGKNSMYSEFGGSSDSRYEYLSSALVGTPEMLTWTAPILPPTVDFPPVVFVGAVTIDVNVVVGGAPLEDARVAIHKGSNFSYAMTDGSGDVSISLTTDPSIPLILVVTGPNIYPFEDTIDVIVSGVGIYAAPVTFEDVVGDGDGIINPGETIRFFPKICNLGTESASGLTGYLRCAEAIDWIDSVSVFSAVAPGDTVTGDEVRFQIPSSYLDCESINISMTIVGHHDGPWARNITPQPSVVYFEPMFESAVINDPGPLGNGDGVLTPGEVADICLTLNNVSQARLTNVLGTLLGTDRVAVIQELASIDDWGRGAEVTLDPCYTISLSPDIEPAEAIELGLRIRGTGSIYDYLDTIPIPLVATGSVSNLPTGPDSYGYYIIDDTDEESNIEPTYAWDDITSIGYELTNVSDGDDRITTIGLPFTMKFYGVNYDSITVASNGYICPGRDDYSGGGTGTPQSFPNVGGPQGIIAPVWSDLAPHRPDGGEIYAYNDASNHQFVVEWDACSFYYAGGIVTYQLRICNPAYWATPTGDSEFYVYYNTFTGLGVMGVGIESRTETIGLEYFRDGVYEENAAVITAGRALRITTVEPDIPSLPWLFNVGLPVLDDSSGNNNGIVEPGEDIGIRLFVHNAGVAMAPTAKGVVLDTTYITSSSIEALYGNIMPGDTAYNFSDAMHLTISPLCPTDTVIEVPIELSALGGWYSTYTKIWIHVGSSVEVDEKIILPSGIELYPNYPNPFNSAVNIEFSVGSDIANSNIKLDIYDVSGRHVDSIVNGKLKAGRFSFEWNAVNLPSGCYFARLRAGNKVKTTKLLLLR